MFSFNKIGVNKVINNNINNYYFPKVAKEQNYNIITNSVFIKFINKQDEDDMDIFKKYSKPMEEENNNFV